MIQGKKLRTACAVLVLAGLLLGCGASRPGTENTGAQTPEAETETAGTQTAENAAVTVTEAAELSGTTRGTNETMKTRTPYEEHGRLSVSGASLVDERGNTVQLRGVSTSGIAWYPEYVSFDSFRTLRDDWNANVVRLAMYTEEEGGYCTRDSKGKEDLLNVINTGVKAASELGLYVIVDWHILSDGDPKTNEDEALRFFDTVSRKYADQGNVLYEICNEPNGDDVTWEDVKDYAEQVIPVIRKNAPDSVILVGSPVWSQEISWGYEHPLPYDNIMYTVHFYAATHGDDLRARVEEGEKNGEPIFVSEFSIVEASGTGPCDMTSAEKWAELIDRYRLSYCGWNLSNRDETSALLRPECTKTSGWDVSDLSETGIYLRARCLGEK